MGLNDLVFKLKCFYCFLTGCQIKPDSYGFAPATICRAVVDQWQQECAINMHNLSSIKPSHLEMLFLCMLLTYNRPCVGFEGFDRLSVADFIDRLEVLQCLVSVKTSSWWAPVTEISTLASQPFSVPVLNQNHIYFELALWLKKTCETLSHRLQMIAFRG